MCPSVCDMINGYEVKRDGRTAANCGPAMVLC